MTVKTEVAEDHKTLIRMINRVGVYADLHKWDELIEMFAEEVELDYTSLFGGSIEFSKGSNIVAGWSKFFQGFQSTQHLIGNQEVEINGNSATGFAYVHATHYLPNELGDDYWVVAGYYNYKFQRQNGSWKITKMKFNKQFVRGNQGLMALAAEGIS